MKYWRGYLVAAIFAAITWALMQLGQQFTTLVDMVYPYVIRTLQGFLAQWSGSVDFVLWQVLAMAAVIIGLASIVLMVILKWNPIQWFGWVLAVCSIVYMLNTLVFGLNYFAGPIADDIRLDMGEYNVEELAEAAQYYRDRANDLAKRVDRDSSGNVDFADFDTLAQQTGDGFQTLTYTYSYPIFAGDTMPVKKLAWADLFSRMGVTGITVGITGEAAVNPNIPDICLPYIMSHEMAHRMCIATEWDASFAAFLAGHVNESVEYQYSAYFMAYRYCYMSLANSGNATASAAAARVHSGISKELEQDLNYYNNFFAGTSAATATASAKEDTGSTYGQVTDLLVAWHIQQIVLPSMTVEELPFDPYDPGQVDLTGIVNAKDPTEASQETEPNG